MCRVKRAGVLVRSLIAGMAIMGAAGAAADEIVAVPTNWRIQDYGGGAVDLWFTGSSCTNGHLQLAPSVPEGTKDRLWSALLTAKVSDRPIGIFYHFTGSDCIIDSFHFDGPS